MNDYFEKHSWGNGNKEENQEQETAERGADVLDEESLETIRTEIRELRSTAMEKVDTEGPEAISKDATLRQLISWEDEDIESIPAVVLELWKEIKNFNGEDEDKFSDLKNRLEKLLKDDIILDKDHLKDSYKAVNKDLRPILSQELLKKQPHREAA